LSRAEFEVFADRQVLIARSATLRAQARRDVEAIRAVLGSGGLPGTGSPPIGVRRLVFDVLLALAGAQKTSRLVSMAGRLLLLLGMARALLQVLRARRAPSMPPEAG